MKEQKKRIPYIGVRKYGNLIVDYSMERIIFTFFYARDRTISWTIDKPYVTAYPNFQKMSDDDMHDYYVRVILPAMRNYFNFMTFYKMR